MLLLVIFTSSTDLSLQKTNETLDVAFTFYTAHYLDRIVLDYTVSLGDGLEKKSDSMKYKTNILFL